MISPVSFTKNTCFGRIPKLASKKIFTPESLTQDFFNNLIQLETAFHSKSYTLDVLDELVQQYAKAVEYYDSIQDKITSYFTFKIQDVLSTRKSLKMLLEQNSSNSKSDNDLNTNLSIKSKIQRITNVTEQEINSPVIAENHSEESGDEDCDDKRKGDLQRNLKKKDPRSLASIKNQKQRFVSLFQKVESAKIHEEQQAQNTYEKFNNSSQGNDVIVQTGLNKQKDRLRQKLERKRNESFLSFTLNSSNNSFMGSQADSLNNSRVGDVLNELNMEDDLEIKRDDKILGLINDLVLTPTKLLTEKQKKHIRSRSLFSKKIEFSGSKTPLMNTLKQQDFVEDTISQNEQEKYPSMQIRSSVENSFTTTTPFDTKTCVLEVDSLNIDDTPSVA